ncbi:competence/damage-inducible protein A [Nafulsella turpanensis]|uniref:competence/damage-inducible protein A n=1 Tax=Nafulsella turpanensis TaxID=1265690 RepID=UPI0003480FF5|nr:competence/damage-inducible protein A [Nafulsella turpanensis]
MKEIRAEILTIGDELLYGQITDTNAQWMSEKLSEAGIRVVRRTTVGDEEEAILHAFEEAESRADILLITGGLGPTADDLTKPLLSKYFNSPLKVHEDALENIRKIFARRGLELTERNRQQAALPESCRYIPNHHGTAPGMWFDKEGKVFVAMPGVPHEMKHMMEFEIIPLLIRQFNPPAIFHRMVRTSGIGESWLAEHIQEWEEALPPNMKLAYLPGLGEVKLRITAFGEHMEGLQRNVDEEFHKLMPLIEQWVYGEGDDTLAKAVGQLLQKEGKKVAAAESCTSGFVGYTLTSVPGSSFYFNGSVVAYQNEIKESILGVKKETLEQYGAVSEQTAREMAEGARKVLKADYGLSTTGVAGPGGGSAEKPVGLVWIAVSNGEQTIAKKLNFTKDRDLNIRYTAAALLNLFRQTLVKNDWQRAGK